MSCQCHQIGGPFIAEDPDCVIHGWRRGDRQQQSSALQEASLRPDITVDELREIVSQLHTLIDEIY
jgi:hypothetical protein